MKTRSFALLALLISLLPFVSVGQDRQVYVDTAITHFRFAGEKSGIRFYTQNGPDDLRKGEPTAFGVKLIPSISYQLVLALFNSLTSNTTDFRQLNRVDKDTLIGGWQVHYTSYTEMYATRDDYRNQALMGYYFRGDTAVLFISGDQTGGVFADRFRRTFFTLRP